MPVPSDRKVIEKKLDLFQDTFSNYFRRKLHTIHLTAIGQTPSRTEQGLLSYIVKPLAAGLTAATTTYLSISSAVCRAFIMRYIGTSGSMYVNQIYGDYEQHQGISRAQQLDHCIQNGVENIEEVIKETAEEICRIFEEQIVQLTNINVEILATFAVEKIISDINKNPVGRNFFEYSSFLETLMYAPSTKKGFISFLNSNRSNIQFSTIEGPIIWKIEEIFIRPALRTEHPGGYKYFTNGCSEIIKYGSRANLFQWKSATKTYSLPASDLLYEQEIINAEEEYTPLKRLVLQEEINNYCKARNSGDMGTFIEFIARYPEWEGKIPVLRALIFPPEPLLKAQDFIGTDLGHHKLPETRSTACHSLVQTAFPEERDLELASNTCTPVEQSATYLTFTEGNDSELRRNTCTPLGQLPDYLGSTEESELDLRSNLSYDQTSIPQQERSDELERRVRKMEELLEDYRRMKIDNQNLIEALTNIVKKQDTQTNELKQRIRGLEQSVENLQEKIDNLINKQSDLEIEATTQQSIHLAEKSTPSTLLMGWDAARATSKRKIINNENSCPEEPPFHILMDARHKRTKTDEKKEASSTSSRAMAKRTIEATL